LPQASWIAEVNIDVGRQAGGCQELSAAKGTQILQAALAAHQVSHVANPNLEKKTKAA